METVLEDVSGVKYTFDNTRLFTEEQVMEAMRIWGEELAKGKIINKDKVNLDMLPKMEECSQVANNHFILPFEDLDSDGQSEWEGISKGWQEAVVKMNKAIIK